jgi:hypothetical protein
MINEGRGISDINKNEINNIFNLFINSGYTTGIKYKLNNIDIIINFTLQKNYYSNFHYKSFKYFLNIGIPKNYNIIKVKEIITHELNHLTEYNSLTKRKKVTPLYDTIKKSILKFEPKTDELQFFKHFVYKILDNEINAKVSQTYTYLKQFNIDDYDFLLKKLNEYDERIDYINLGNFNENKIIEDIINNQLAKDELIKLNDLFLAEHVYRYLNFLEEIDNINSYIKKWFKFGRINISKLLKKQEYIIKEVIEDMEYTTEFPISEGMIISYNKYIKESLNKSNSTKYEIIRK